MLTGILLVLVGAGWIALRVVIERGANQGSWLSHLAKQFAVIGHIPLVGFLWKVLPVLLLAGGVLWLAGVRPPGLGGGRSRSAEPVMCGAAAARPETVPAAEWSAYACRTRAEAGSAWAACLPQSAYAGDGRGCPGAARCCPP